MKIILGIFSRNNEILHIEESLCKLGHEVVTVHTDTYRMVCPYYKKKLDKIGIHKYRDAYVAGWKKSIYRMVNDFKPHIVLFINLPQDMLNPNDLKYIQDRAKTICWFVDGVSIKSKLIECLKFIGKIYVFENQDTELLRQYSIPAEYLPVGYSEVYKKRVNAKCCGIP